MNDVLITQEPWVGGTRTVSYHMPPIQVSRKVTAVSWEEAVDSVLEEAAQQARDRLCNAIVGIEITCDPYHRDGGVIELVGTAAKLEALFGGPFVASAYPRGVTR